MTYDVLGSHTRTYEFKFKRVEERSFFIAKKGRGGGGEKVVSLGDFVCASKKMQIHTNKIFDLRKYITYRLREMYHFYVCFSDGNHLTGDVHSAWTACVSGTTRKA